MTGKEFKVVVDLSRRKACLNYSANHSFQERINLPERFSGNGVLLRLSSGYTGERGRPYDGTEGMVLTAEERLENLGELSAGIPGVTVYSIKLAGEWVLPKFPLIFVSPGAHSPYHRIELVPFPGTPAVWMERAIIGYQRIYTELEKVSEREFRLTVIVLLDQNAVSSLVEGIRDRDDRDFL